MFSHIVKLTKASEIIFLLTKNNVAHSAMWLLQIDTLQCRCRNKICSAPNPDIGLLLITYWNLLCYYRYHGGHGLLTRGDPWISNQDEVWWNHSYIPPIRQKVHRGEMFWSWILHTHMPKAITGKSGSTADGVLGFFFMTPPLPLYVFLSSLHCPIYTNVLERSFFIYIFPHIRIIVNSIPSFYQAACWCLTWEAF